ncbi:hypothetical protein WN944_025665 [Citrus x changshan-huyou]|uniref:Uncharacterized protein n=1 Tax=Citrus x changshan-huyou TaxID=2935761 RepID=A0AAP0LWK1_9ROSI
MIELAPLAPFGARFNTKNVATTKNAGPAVPTMDLELRGIVRVAGKSPLLGELVPLGSGGDF